MGEDDFLSTLWCEWNRWHMRWCQPLPSVVVVNLMPNFLRTWLSPMDATPMNWASWDDMDLSYPLLDKSSRVVILSWKPLLLGLGLVILKVPTTYQILDTILQIFVVICDMTVILLKIAPLCLISAFVGHLFVRPLPFIISLVHLIYLWPRDG